MTNQEIFDAALRMCCEGNYSLSYTKDYTERAPYILASFFSHTAPLVEKYRDAHRLDVASRFEGVTVALTEAFPIPSVFTSAAVFYLSAMLTIEENEEMSDKFFALCNDELSRIEATLPMKLETIVNKYA
jgi:hypothetical protein